jgi:vancomycin resistance protein YoaR
MSRVSVADRAATPVAQRPGPASPEPSRGGGLWLGLLLGTLAVLVLAPLAALGWYQYEHRERIYPGVSALGVDLGGLTRPDAERVLAARASELTGRTAVVRAEEIERRVDWGQIGLRLPTAPIVELAYSVGRVGSPLAQAQAQIGAASGGTAIPAEQGFDEAALDRFVGEIAAQAARPVRDARLEMKPDLTFELTTAQVGRVLDADESRRRLYQAVTSAAAVVELPVTMIQPTTTDEMRRPAKEKAERLLAGPLVMTYNDRRWTVERQELADLLVFTGGPGVPLAANLNTEPILAKLKAIAGELEQKSEDARLDWNGGNPRPIRPSRDGRELDLAQATQMLNDRLESADRTIALPVKTTKPAVDASQIGQMGLREKIDGATTTFAGSVPQKAHNIKLAASRLNGVVVPPRGLFSFNRELGPTTLQNGYQTAFGITGGAGEQHKTVPSVAGGICQVATTLFQPIFWSGYQLEERHWHLYWIPAYTSRNVVGLDATVDEEYNLDLQFFNNTDTHLLIQSRTDDQSVTFELYGTKPAWQVKVDGPAITDRKSADPAQVTQPEPSLPEGQRLAVETAREGFTATFNRAVTENGNVRTLKLESKYVPSRNVTLVGTGGRPAAPQGGDGGQNRPVSGPNVRN